MFDPKPLGEAVAFHTGGGTPSRQVPSYWDGGIPWASVKDFTEEAEQISSTQETISQKGLRASASNLIPAGTPLVCTRMAVGRSAMTTVPMAINQDVKALYPAAGFKPDYLLALLQFTQRFAEAQSIGSTVKGIRIQDYLAIPVPQAPTVEQSKIAEVIATLNRAIRQTEAIVEKLKQVKRGLLHDLLTRGVAANGELRPSYEDAPDLYQESPLGWIPKDWNYGNLEAWLEGKPKNGYSPQEAPERTGIQMLGLGCLTTEGFSPVQLKAAPRNDKKLASAMLTTGDLLISRANTRELVGLVGVYKDVGTPCTYPDLMMRLKSSSGTSAEFLQLVLQASKSRRQIQIHAVGTSESMVKISGQIVSSLLVALPKKTEQNRVLERMDSCDARLIAESDKATVLREIKDGLMDDLLTGRVRVTPFLAQ